MEARTVYPQACPYCNDRGVVLACRPGSPAGVLVPCACMWEAAWDRVIER